MKPGRNDPCSCGSGKKYKYCCEGKVAPRSRAPSHNELNQLIALFNARLYTELENRAHSLVRQYPDSGLSWKLLGSSLQRQGKSSVVAFQKAAELMPNDHEIHLNLGLALYSIGQLKDAEIRYRRALKLKPDYVLAHNSLGSILLELGQLEEAVVCCRRVVELKPEAAEAHNNLGAALYRLGQQKEAIACCRRALELNPNSPEALNNLGSYLKVNGQFDEAEANYRKAIELNPDNYKAHGNLGNLLKDVGKIEEAIASYRLALKINPDFTDVYSNLLFTLNFSSSFSPEYCLEQTRHFGRLVTRKVGKCFSTWQCTPQPERLRVGLVSGDLRTHSVGHFLEGPLSHLDRDRIELIAYPTNPEEDDLSARIRPFFNVWKPLVGLNDEDAARLIHSDGIHVLIDVSGHTAHNRLPIFAWKPAPVQVTWLGLPYTTGVSEIDFILGDLQAIPPKHESHFSETVWRMPDSYLCFSAPTFFIEIASLPALSSGFVTFGSFNNLSKMNDAVVELWARILLSVPNSRLYLKASQLDDESIREHTFQRFGVWGVMPEQLLLGGKLGSIAEHLSEYNKIDIALDTFPYTGVTTSVEAMWMGVPVLTLYGDKFLSLTAASIAHHTEMLDWVATDKNDYVAKAVTFASDLERLATLRVGLRQQVLESPVFDTHRFAKNFEDALWGMWHKRNKQE